MERIIKRHREGRLVRDSRRLVPVGPPRVDIAAEIKRATGTPMVGYEPRVTMIPKEIREWKSRGSKFHELPGRKPGDPIVSHQEFSDRVLRDDGKRIFSKGDFKPTVDPLGYTTDRRGRPIVPHLEDYLRNGFLKDDFRYFYGYGPKEMVDLVFVIKQRRFLIGPERYGLVVIRRRDLGVPKVRKGRTIAFIGGGVEKEDRSRLDAALREGYEEAFSTRKEGIDLVRDKGKRRDFNFRLVDMDINHGDPRNSQLTAWAEAAVYLMMAKSEGWGGIRIKKKGEYPRRAQSEKDDAKGARAVLAKARRIKDLAFSHPRFAYEVFDVVQRIGRRQGIAIDMKGRPGRPQTPIAGEEMIQQLAKNSFAGKWQSVVKIDSEQQAWEVTRAAYIAFCAVELACSQKQDLRSAPTTQRVANEIERHWKSRNPRQKMVDTKLRKQFASQASAAIDMYMKEFFAKQK